MTSLKKLVILELEGLSSDSKLEEQVFECGVGSKPNHGYEVEFVRGNLAPGGDGVTAPISSLSPDLLREVSGLMVFRHYLTREDIALMPKLQVVVRMGVGYDRLDRVALAERNIVVCNVPDYGTNEIADHALALALSLRRGILLHHELQRHAPPAPWQPADSPLVARLQGQVFGVLGLGRIGMAAALRAKAFGWRVLFYDPFVPNGMDKALQITQVKDIRDLFAQSTTLSIHCPLTKATRRLVDSSLLDLLPVGAILVNTARGEIVDLDAVEDALRSGKLAGAGLDVLPVEPIPNPAPSLIQAYRNKEGWLEGRLVITPHNAFYSPSSFEDIRLFSAQTMSSVLIDGEQVNIVKPEDE